MRGITLADAGTISGKKPIEKFYRFMLFFPVFWILGFEQFIYLFLLLYLVLKYSFHENLLEVNKLTKYLFYFVIVYCISFLFIVDYTRYLTFFRNLSTYITGLLLFFLVEKNLKSFDQIEKMLRGLFYVVLFSSILSLIVIVFQWTPTFQSAIGYILPGWIKDTSYGGLIATRQLSEQSWFLIIGGFTRPSGTFMYSTLYGTTLAFSLPIIIYLHNQSTKSEKFVYKIGLFIILTVFVFTTARGATGAFILSGVVWYFLYSKNFKKYIAFFLCFFSLVAFVGLFWNELIDAFNQFLYARGGSTGDRMDVYQATLKGFLERPLFGWGTERDVVGLTYPAGSHSYILGTLYKQGLVGLILFLVVWYQAWKMTDIENTIPQLKAYNPKKIELLRYGKWSIMAAFINSFTEVIDLDATTMLLFWILIASLMGTKRILKMSKVKYKLVRSA